MSVDPAPTGRRSYAKPPKTPREPQPLPIMKVDNKPIINRVKLDMHVIDEETTHGDNNPDTCTFSSRCQLVEKIPPNEGIMVLMDEPILDNPHSTDGNKGAKKSCTCLKIQPQMDSNLAGVHPNIYIPSVLLDYPEHIVKYGGGGSGVTGKKFLWFLPHLICYNANSNNFAS